MTLGIRLSEGRFAGLLVLPALLGIFAVVLLPLLYSLWLSFTDVDVLRTSGPAIELFGVRVPLFRWVGLQNYVGILDFEFGAFNGLLYNLRLIEGSIGFFKDGFSALNVLVSVYA